MLAALPASDNYLRPWDGADRRIVAPNVFRAAAEQTVVSAHSMPNGAAQSEPALRW